MTTPFDSSTTSNPGISQIASQDQASQPTQTQPFPSPQTFTFLPQLYALISRLAPLQPSSASQSQTNGTPATGGRASRSPTLTRRSAPDQTQSQAVTDATAAPLSLAPTRSREETIDIKDLPALVYPLRQQIERAKEVVRGLPDVERSIAEQETEIRELEGRVRGLKGRLGELGGLAAGQGGVALGNREDVVMQGMEG